MRSVYAVASVITSVCSARHVAAAPPSDLALTTSSQCPDAAAVARELAPLLPNTKLIVDAAPNETREQANVEDRESEFLVSVAGAERLFQDPSRSCRERARSAAVFIGLVLDPPVLEASEPRKPPEKQPLSAKTTPAARQPQTSSDPTHLGLELGPSLLLSPDSDASKLPLVTGFTGRLVWGQRLALSVGAAVYLPVLLHFEHADAELTWLPLDVSLRVIEEQASVSFAAELGPQLALLFASGARVKNPRSSTRLELGARAAASATWHVSPSVGAFATLSGVWIPKPSEFELNPDLATGSTPAWWLGITLGAAVRFL
jgi:hypothetical protein